MRELTARRDAKAESIGSIQEWMFEAITSEHEPLAADVLERLTESDRIEIYRGMYEARMLDTLAADYPAVAAFVGEHDFGHLAHDYAAEYPSRSYTLNRLGDHFPRFLLEGTPLEDREFLHDLARVELAMTEVFDEAEVPLLEASAIAAITPDSKLRLVPALRLLELDFPANDAFQSWRDEDPLVVPGPARTWLAVYRRDYSVIRMPLEGKAYRFLSELASGATLAEACDRILPEQEELFAWFRDWSSAGFFGMLE